MYLLSNLYRSGLGVPKDLHQAFRLSSEAASNGEKAAYRGLSWAYFLGDEVEKDEAKSLEWARKAADAGDTEMMLRVSNGYEEGRVLKRSLAAWMYYLEKAARAGNPEAMRRYSEQVNNISIYMYIGDTLNSRKSRIEESVDWLVKSAEAGNQIAMNVLSYEYEGRMGSRVRPDRKKAFEWSKKAAASGLPFAIACLSRLYRLGVGCKQNEEEADSLLEQAKKAAKGDEKMISSVEMWSRSSPFEALASSPPSGSSQPKDDEIAKSPPKHESSTPRRKAARSKTTPINREILSGTKLILLDLAISPALEGKVMHIDGRVKNISDEPIKDVRVNVSLETAGGKPLGTTRGFASPDPIPPGATATFRAREYDNLSFGHVTLDFVEHGDNAIPWHDQTGMKVSNDLWALLCC
jgi:TPR repeat protein